VLAVLNTWQNRTIMFACSLLFCRTINALMRYGTIVQACVAAALYSWLLRAPDAPVSTLAALHSSIQMCWAH
jgi:hypothetical protein